MGRHPEWSEDRKTELIGRWNAGEQPLAIRRAMGLTKGQLAGRITKYHLHTPAGARLREFDQEHPAVLEGRSRFQQRVTDHGRALKTGNFQRKLGGRVTKGAWKGMPIFALTLEERVTCPSTCSLWTLCMGDHMGHAQRMRHGPALEAKLAIELRELQRRYPGGFVVRLHILGDFYSTAYVRRWLEWLRLFPALRVFGYTAHRTDSEIGRLVRSIARANWGRFAIRTSGALSAPRAVVVETESDAARIDSVLCPAQNERLARAGKQVHCGSCALCWSTQKTISFLLH